MKQRLKAVSLVVMVALLASACAAARAFRRGEEAARAGDWEAAVAHYRRAVQEDPDKPEYKIKLERAMLNAASEYISRARALEEKGQLDLALRAYRRVLELDSANQTAAAKAAELERRIREQVEAARPVPRIEQLRAEARRISPEPILNPASREPINVTFNNAAIRDILNFLGDAAGINVTYDQQAETIVNRGYTVELEGVTFEQALDQVLTANGLFYKVLNPRTIIVIPDTLQKHLQYDELVVRTFFLSHADATEIATMLVQMAAVQQGVRPVITPNKTANTVTVRATAAMADVIERIIRANDKPRAEIVLDVEILEVSRTRLKEFGLNLNAYSIDLLFSPEQRPGTGQQGGVTVPPFNLNIISQGVSTADFYLAVPQAVVRFLETDAHSRILAKPQLRGAEGTQLTLNLGQEVPVLQTVFGAAAPGGFATIPQSSFQYRTIGVNLTMTPRVTYEGEIILELAVENSALGPSLQVAGQTVPSFTTRRVSTKLRLREGESNLLAGLIREDSRRSLTGLPGLLRVPGFRQLFSGNRNESEESDIVMLITPHIVRSHELTPEDLAPIYIGTQQRVALSGAPQLIAPQPPREEAGAAAPGAPAA
ncbi:MAG TPA: secretin N-terminal domain-containing protein, partial [Vicinamibacterales bacterium]|nr:secretin N-terminal domain-containing protein [Vicinamibacterales bacterium]